MHHNGILVALQQYKNSVTLFVFEFALGRGAEC